MADVHRDGDGLVLVEHHCPICTAATACPGFCRSELELFRDTLGPDVTVERTAHLLAGDVRCAYLIRPVDAAVRASAEVRRGRCRGPNAATCPAARR